MFCCEKELLSLSCNNKSSAAGDGGGSVSYHGKICGILSAVKVRVNGQIGSQAKVVYLKNGRGVIAGTGKMDIQKALVAPVTVSSLKALMEENGRNKYPSKPAGISTA